MKKLLFVLLLIPALAAATPSEVQQLTGLGMAPELAKKLTTLPKNNNTYIKAKNAAGSADIEVLKVDATDDTVLNADTGDVIKLSVAGTAVQTISATETTMAQDVAFGALKMVGNNIGTLAAAGSTITDAAAVATTIARVTAADGTKGVKLPALASVATGGLVLIINSDTSSALKVYGNAAGETITGQSGSTAINLAAKLMLRCVKYNASNWYCEKGVTPY